MVVGEALEAPSPPLQGGATPSQLTHRLVGMGGVEPPTSEFSVHHSTVELHPQFRSTLLLAAISGW